MNMIQNCVQITISSIISRIHNPLLVDQKPRSRYRDKKSIPQNILYFLPHKNLLAHI